MATTSTLELTSTSSSTPVTWDVFLSFYGKDTRGNFTSHLYSALVQAGMKTFVDDPELQKGQEISSGIVNAITDSKTFVVVLSENYARSLWCLDELAEILNCNTTENQVVPVFYYVDPSDVRHQKGSFGEALESHKKLQSVDKIKKWKSALTHIAELSGYHLKKQANENESETIQEIVKNMAQQVSTKVLYLEKEPPGIDSAVEEIYQKLRMEINHVRAIGICGMGGIGKTTIAKAFCNKYSNRFDISYFIDKVKQYSQGDSVLPLLNQVLTGLLKKKDYKVTDVESGFNQLKQILCFKKTLIVLDDLDQSSYSKFLVTLCNLFSVGSRIIVTTRDVNLLNQLRIDITEVDTYMVKKLGKADSLELFSYHAFRTSTPPAHLEALSESFVTYAGGLPLALKVLGSSLRGRNQDESFWKAKLKKVREIPEKEIMEILQLSYKELDDETVKSIFLDIACFFVGKFKYDAIEIFKSCDFHPEVGVPILLERCLLTIDKNDKFQMHDLIQEMGRNLAKSTHLFLRYNAWEDLQNQKESNEIECLILDLSRSTKKQISSQIFEKLPKLRLLEILGVHGINGHFRNSFQELRCIYWSYCTWTQLPSSFRPKKLISLHMPFSHFTVLWNDRMPFKSLKAIDVSYSVKLKMTPNFRNSKLVKWLGFRGCESLLKLHPSIRDLTSLYVLDLRECTHLKELVKPIEQLNELGHLYLYGCVKRSPEPMKQWCNMCNLFLGHCSNVRQLPKQMGDMKWLKWLDASHTAIEELPDSITQLKELVELDLSNCKNLRKLPEQIGNMQGLKKFSACNSAIEQVPDSFVHLINLERLDLSFCKKLRNLPNSIWKLNLVIVHLQWCLKLERLPEQLGKMQCLKEFNASFTAIAEVPDSIGQLSRLQLLDLSSCKNLKHLPNSVWNLTSLTGLYLLQADIGIINLPDTVLDTKLVTLSLNCNIRLWLLVISSFSSLKHLVLCDNGESLTSTKLFSLSKLYNLQYLELYSCTSFGSLFPELPGNLTHLRLSSHAILVHLPDLSSLKWLKKLEIFNCISLESLPPLPPLLQSLTVYDCTSLHDLPDMSMLKNLVNLSFGRCGNFESVGLKQSFLQVVQHFLPLFKADVPKIAEWFSYKSRGCTLSFDIPQISGDEFLGVALWVLFTSKNSNHFKMLAVVANISNGVKKYCGIPVYCVRGAEVYSLVKCVSGDQISIRSGDTINISFKRQLYSLSGGEVPYEEVKVEMCAAQVIQKTPTTPNFPSVLKNLMNGA